MKLNKKGFTLIELLAVIVILLAISVIAVTSISAVIERNKVKQNDAKIEVIESYAKLYYEEHKNSLGSTGCIELDKLGLSDSESKDADGNLFTGGVSYTDGKEFQYVDSCS
ncbi:MAG: type II secretion system protein [Bacilli bacterium]|nr:type II secretion system protein [Bacilli bacterium]